MARRQRAPGAQRLEVLQLEPVAAEEQLDVLGQRGVPARQDEPVAAEPRGVGRVVRHDVLEEQVRGRSQAHRGAGVTVAGLLHGIRSQHADGVDGAHVEVAPPRLAGHGPGEVPAPSGGRLGAAAARGLRAHRGLSRGVVHTSGRSVDHPSVCTTPWPGSRNASCATGGGGPHTGTARIAEHPSRRPEGRRGHHPDDDRLAVGPAARPTTDVVELPRPHQAADHRAAPRHDRAGDVPRRGWRAVAVARRRHPRRGHA